MLFGRRKSLRTSRATGLHRGRSHGERLSGSKQCNHRPLRTPVLRRKQRGNCSRTGTRVRAHIRGLHRKFADHIAKSNQNAELGAAGAFLVTVLGEFNEMNDDEVEELAQDVYVMGATANSPQYELEADYYMALILENAGIDLEHGKALLVRLARAGSDSVTPEQSGWGVNALLMATTHPADGPRIARWIAISNAMERSRMAPPADDEELRSWAIEELVTPPTSRGKSILWINSKNGHSGIVRIAAVRVMRRCETPNYFAQCIKYRHREFQMDGIGSEIRYVCSIPTDVRDDSSWSWWYMGTTPPWKKFSDGCPMPQFEHVWRHVPSE